MHINERTMNRKLAKTLYFSFHKKEPSINRAEINPSYPQNSQDSRLCRPQVPSSRLRARIPRRCRRASSLHHWIRVTCQYLLLLVSNALGKCTFSIRKHVFKLRTICFFLSQKGIFLLMLKPSFLPYELCYWLQCGLSFRQLSRSGCFPVLFIVRWCFFNNLPLIASEVNW